jgi:hypothetical protein
MNSSRFALSFATAVLVLGVFSTPARAERAAIISPADATPLERLAAREVRRYVYLRTGDLLPNRDTRGPGTSILVGRSDRLIVLDVLPSSEAPLNDQEYSITSVARGDDRLVCVTGGSDVAVLYAAYRFAELLGVRFYLHGDVVPDDRGRFTLPSVNERGAPRFALRGIQPFHDFAEGPDWWGVDTYKAIIGQLPKLGMNFIGLHTYPIVEPTVWIGAAEDVGPDGKVRSSYPTRYYNTAKTVGWGYNAKKTGDYACGGALLFDRDDYGSDVMRGLTPEPATPEASNEMFERTGRLLAEAFGYATSLDIKTCVGTETPLAIPDSVRERWKETPDLTKKLYEGIFTRIIKTYPLDYYWLWTPEGWTWESVKPEQIDATVKDILLARDALTAVGAPFQLATCGWVLGPQADRALFDRVLPKDVSVSCINRAVGHDPVDPGFAQVQGRGKWAIPWLEDDPALASPQLWVGRMNRDAQDALTYGCTGLMGIHWRTRILAPNVAALAQASWSRGGGNANAPLVDPITFYADWVLHEFGPGVATDAARIFVSVDGKLPRPSDWVGGPGGFAPDKRPWETVAPEYAFVDEFARLDRSVRGAGNRARFEYWRETFEFLRGTGHMRCVYFTFSESLKKAKAETDAARQKQLAREEVLPLRVDLVAVIRDAYEHLLATVNTPGEMGTVCNFEQHTFPVLLDAPGHELEAMLGGPLPPEAQLPKTYTGPPRVFVPVVRTALQAGEPLRVTAVVLDARQPKKITLRARPLGQGNFQRVAFRHAARNTYTVELDVSHGPLAGQDFEYYVDVRTAKGGTLKWPPTAPRVNQTVVVTSTSPTR